MHKLLHPKLSRLITPPRVRFTSNLIELLQSMPKEPKHLVDLQSRRKKFKERQSRYVPGKISVQVLGTGAHGAPASLYVFTDQARYLFNCGEGTQRLAHEHKMKLARLEHIFITQPVWKNMGGLPGTALTIQDVGVPQITLHGPKGIPELFKATKRFVIMKHLKIEMADCDPKKNFEDNTMSVKYVILERNRETSVSEEDEEIYEMSSSFESRSSESSSVQTNDASTSTRGRKRRRRSRSRNSRESRLKTLVEDETDYYERDTSSKGLRRRSKSRSQSRSRSSSVGSASLNASKAQECREACLETRARGTVMAYICRINARPGSLNLDKCVKFGVKPGPLLGKLKNGEDVELSDGTIVKSEDVCEPDDPGPVFIVVDCPTEEYLDSLIHNQDLTQHQKYAVNDEDVAYLVVHFTPKHIIETSRYKDWMNAFTPSTRHFVVNDMNMCMGSVAVHRIQHKLHLLNSRVFPLLGDKGTEGEQVNLYPNGIIQPKTGGMFHLRPKLGYDKSTEVLVEPDDYVKEVMDNKELVDQLTDLRDDWEKRKDQLKMREYPQILFLGTGSCIPNKTRNTSGIFLQTSENNNILMDCGEGTYGQLVRFYGEKEVRQVVANTNAVYISHLHADHHIGLIGFLQGRRRARRALGLPIKPVYLFAPAQISSWLNFYDLYFEDIEDDYRLIPNGDLLINNKSPTDYSRIMETLKMADISTCQVRHCPNAFGVALTSSDKYKITYSGDTMPCDSLVELGADSDLLIHEATMEDELSQEAAQKMHSTTSEAISIGQRMHAKNVILTHFSQRYAKLPRYNESFEDEANMNVGLAFDNMKVKLDEIQLLPLMQPALQLMFAEHQEELEVKAAKRQLKREREEAKRSRSSSVEDSIPVKTEKVQSGKVGFQIHTSR